MSKGKEAVAFLKDSLTEYSNEEVTFVNTTDLRGALAYVEELEAKVPAGPVRPFKVGDKVQEICDETGDEKPVGTVVDMGTEGQLVSLENTRHKGRKLFYFDNEIEPYAAVSETTFKVGQKVETTETIQQNKMIVKAGTVGTVVEVRDKYERMRQHKTTEFEVMFSGGQGTFSFGFDADELKAV